MRRKPMHLVAALAVASAVYGLHAALGDRSALAGDEPSSPAKDTTPKWWNDALAEMRSTKTPGVAIVLPADKETREKLRAQIEELLRNAPIEAQVHLVEAVYVMADGSQVGAQKGETAVLLDETGKRVAGANVRFTLNEFAHDIRPLLRAGDRLSARARAARTPEFEKSLSGLDTDDAEKASPVATALGEKFATNGPAVIEAWEAAKPGPAKQWLEWMISTAFMKRRGGMGTESERPLPFGVRWKKDGTPEPTEDPCPPCGMMARRPRSGEVIEFLTGNPGTAK